MENIKKAYETYTKLKKNISRQIYETAVPADREGCRSKITKTWGGAEMNLEEMSLEELAETQEKHRQQMDASREKARIRKERTHRLIVIGSTLAKYMPELTDMSDDDIRMRVARLGQDAKTD